MDFLPYLIVCPLVFLAGLVDSIGGGGGLISLPAFLLAGLPAHMALGTNKLCSAIGTSASTIRFLKNGFVKGKLAAASAVCALMGSALGARAALYVPEQVTQWMMLVSLPFIALFVLKNKNMGDNEKTWSLPEKKVYLIALAASFAIGAYDGFYGPGTGTFLLLIFTGAAHMDMRTAAGNTKIVNLSSNIAALTTFVLHGRVVYPLGLAGAVFCMAGHYVGSGLVLKNGKKIVRPVILVVLCLLFLKIVSGF